LELDLYSWEEQSGLRTNQSNPSFQATFFGVFWKRLNAQGCLAAIVVENALLAPQKAVTEIQSTKVVYVVGADNKVALRSVVLGDRVGQDYIITEGVKAGERIIIEGLQKARPGATVNPSEQPVSSESASAKKG